MKRTLSLSLALGISMLFQSLLAQRLTLEVRNIEKPVGAMYVGLYNSWESFMKQPVASFARAVNDTLMVVVCNGLPPGEYAVSLFHDENNNGRLDAGNYGIPLEKYGVSNNAKGRMGHPTYRQCAFALRSDTLLVIGLQ
ncbi:MAG: DUF2141 domain-containing protein [Prevotellaceae bacterium]|jgi:uncharacterized protein (DUF2141 family)|nr:DUF2141 domain-containing protein [Prevotellaceae bacterium]